VDFHTKQSFCGILNQHLKDQIGSFRPTNPSGLMKKYYGYMGGSFYRWDRVLFTGDAQIGGYNPK
jgi:hypothetical protein